MSNIEIALAAVSAVVVGIAAFSAIWFRVEKREKELRIAAERKIRAPFFGGGIGRAVTYTPTGATRDLDDLLTTYKER